MQLKRRVRQTRVFDSGRRIHLSGGVDAVLLVHGWTGWPGRLSYLAHRLHEAGFTVSVPRLPGHGTSISDMRRTRADDWLQRSVDEYLDLAAEHRTVHLVGTSMGALIATMIAAEFDLDRLVLLAPAFTNRNRLIKLTPLMRWLVRRVPGGWRADEESDPGAVELGRTYATHNYLALAARLLRLQRAGRRALTRLRSRTLVVVSNSDRTVAPEVADVVKKRSAAVELKTVVVERSNHQIAEHVDRETVAAETIAWLSAGGEPARG